MGKREDVLRKVQLLLDKADSTTFDEERDALIAKADALMIQYAIESFELGKREATKSEKVVIREVKIGNSIIRDQLVDLANTVAGHTRCRLVISGRANITLKFVGFEGDTEYADMLFTSLWLQLTTKLEPKPDPSLTVEENIIMLLENGQKRERVCELIGWEFHRDHGKVSRIWRKHVEALGEYYKPRSRPSVQAYSRSFAHGFNGEVSHRLFKIREARGDYDKVESSTAIVLKDRNKQVSKAMDEMFPKLGTYRDSTNARFSAAANGRGREAGKQADLGQPKVKSTPALGG